MSAGQPEEDLGSVNGSINLRRPVFYSDESDCTYYFESREVEKSVLGADGHNHQAELHATFDEICPATESRLASRDARAMFTRCFAGACYSLTARKKRLDPKPVLSDATKEELQRREDAAQKGRRIRNSWNAEIPSGHSFLIGADPLVDILFEHVFPNAPTEAARGLLIISGQTGSGKSEVTRRLLMKYLTMVSADRTPPHLLTFEDPIEEYVWPAKWVLDPSNWPLPFDYTPRQKTIDALSLKDIISAALRQTPAALYIGETRKTDDWKDLVEFAGTGHLVVTTSHAGSLTECMDTLFRACGATTPSGRSEIADRVLGIIHIRAHKIESGRQGATGKPQTVKCQIPALWRRTTQGSKLLMAEGLSAITPGLQDGYEHDQSSFGRSHFAEVFLKRATTGEGLSSREKQTELRKASRDWDLAGE